MGFDLRFRIRELQITIRKSNLIDERGYFRKFQLVISCYYLTLPTYHKIDLGFGGQHGYLN